MSGGGVESFERWWQRKFAWLSGLVRKKPAVWRVLKKGGAVSTFTAIVCGRITDRYMGAWGSPVTVRATDPYRYCAPT